MKIRMMSDIHYEMGAFYIEEMPDDKNTVLVLAGDIGLLEKAYTYVDFITECCDQFKHVIFVYGNHEYYRGDWPYSHNKAVEHFKYLENIHFGYEFTAVVDDVAFICSTLWTNFNNGDASSMQAAKNSMNDFRIIRTGPKEVPYLRKFDPIEAYKFHDKTLKFMAENITHYQEEGKKIIVVTHHQPSLKSINEKYIGTPDLNGAYVSDLEPFILEHKPSFWFAGHVHDSFNYFVGETNVIVNPTGYPMERNPKFNPRLTIEI